MDMRNENGDPNNSLGVKVEGDLGDLQIVEDSSGDESSEPENCNQVCNVPSIPKDLVHNSTSPVFGSVAVTNSDHVQFGNNTYFNGPVVIKQVIQTSSGIDNKAYTQTEQESTVQGKYTDAGSFIQKFKVGKWQKLVFIAVGVVIVGSICTVVTVQFLKSQNAFDEDQDFTEKENSIDGLIIAPGHLRIVSRTDWLAQPVPVEHITKIKQPVPWVIITHTATSSCHSQSECVLNVRLMQTFHIESKNWEDIGYNFLVGGDGSAYYGRGWDYVGAHTKGYNFISISIAFIGTFNTESPTKRQVEACKKLINLGVAQGKLAGDYKLFGHRQLMSTLSPGDKVFEIISKWPHFVTTTNETDVTKLMPKS